MRIKLILAAVVVAGAAFAAWLIKHQYDKITALEAKKNELEAVIEKEKQANVEANKQIKKLRELKANDNEVNDWSNMRIPHSLSLLLQERYGKSN